MPETPVLDLTTLGFSAGLDLPGLVRAVEAKDLMERAGTCSHPIRLVGSRTRLHKTTGEVLSVFDSATLPEGVITVPCGTRRASVCGYCSTLYKYDAYNVVVSGLRGGAKGVPSTVTGHPRLFVTVTAPSFGPVHLGPDKQGRTRPCRPRRDGSGCKLWHRSGDPLIGQPLDADGYDYPGHVLFNALASSLWSRTTIEIRRALAEGAGVSRRDLPKVARLSYVKVAEYQVRGIVHFHVIVRLDGPGGPVSAPPAWATSELLSCAVRSGIARVSLPPPRVGSPSLTWGSQVDIRPIGQTNTDPELSGLGSPDLADTTVARYLAKYATKAAEDTGADLSSLCCRSCVGTGTVRVPLPDVVAEDGTLTRAWRDQTCPQCSGAGTLVNLGDLDLTPHARRLIETCWQLGADPDLADLGLRKWAHMLGFKGHFATKSRDYSTTFGALRQERADFTAHRQDQDQDFDLDEDDGEEDTVLVINDWRYAGRGAADTRITPVTPPTRGDRP